MEPKESPDSDISQSPTNETIPTKNIPHSEKELDSYEITDAGEKMNKGEEMNSVEIPIDQVSSKKDQMKKLKILSIIVSILASIGSVAYYAYSIFNGDIMILKPADTVIIQNSDLQLDEVALKDKTTEKSVIDKIMELQKTKREFIPLDYYVGKILEVNIPEPGESNKYRTTNDPKNAGLTLKIQKTYDIANKKRLKDQFSCTIDSVNARFFQKWKELKNDDLDTPGIKLRADDLIGFRYTKKNEENVCELFQINSINLNEYFDSIKSMHQNNSSDNSTSITGRIENFIPIDRISFPRNPQGELGIGSTYGFKSSAIDNLIFLPGINNNIVIFVTTYFQNNPNSPIGNVSCKLRTKQTQELSRFFIESNLSPLDEKDRFSIQLQGSGKTNNIMINSNWIFINSLFYPDCMLEKVSLLDMGHRNIIDEYIFTKE